jgi:cell division protein FtsZ
MTLHDVNEASSLIHEEAHEDAHIIFGAVIDESMGDAVRVTVIATGFGKSVEERKGQRGRIAPAMVIENLDVPTKIRKDKEKAIELGKGELHRVGKLWASSGVSTARTRTFMTRPRSLESRQIE